MILTLGGYLVDRACGSREILQNLGDLTIMRISNVAYDGKEASIFND